MTHLLSWSYTLKPMTSRLAELLRCHRPVLGCTLALVVWFGSTVLSAAQRSNVGLSSSAWPAGSARESGTAGSTSAQGARQDQTGRDAAEAEYPSLRLSGFGDFAFARQNKSEGTRGFSEGQFVLHLTSAL